MAIDGRINVDVLFHDTDGTASLKVVSLEDSTAYTTGKVAVVTGTCGTAAVSVNLLSSTYRDAAGNAVTFSSVSRLAFAASGASQVKCDTDIVDGARLVSSHGVAAVSDVAGDADSAFVGLRNATAGTAAYTLVIYGT